MARLVMRRFESGTFSDGTFCMCINQPTHNITSDLSVSTRLALHSVPRGN